MRQDGTKISLYSVIFVHAYLSLWETTFTLTSLWSKSINHILMNMWWWDFWQTFTILLAFSGRKCASMVPRWHWILLYCACLFITTRKIFRPSTLWSKSKIHILMARWWDFRQKFTILLFVFQENKPAWYRWNCILLFLCMPNHHFAE